MAIINETEFDAFFYSNRTDGVYKKLLQSLSNALTSEEATYVDDGIFTIPGSNSMQSPDNVETEGASVNQIAGEIGLQTRQFGTQEPQATVFVKKKVFSTLRSNFDSKFLGDEEKFFLKATKQLFENKTNEIAAYERLLKVHSFLKEGVVIKEDIKALLADIWAGLTEKDTEKAKAFQTVIRANQEEFDSVLTKWIEEIEPDEDSSNIGRGVGVIELTAFTNFDTALSLNPGDLGSCGLSIEDPYHILFITVADIDKAMMQVDPLLVPANSKKYFDAANLLDQQYNERFGRYPVTIKFDLRNKSVSIPVFAEDRSTQLKSTPVPSEARDLAWKIYFALIDYVDSIGSFEELQTQRNKTNNYVRNKMLKFYNGKAIVQPMDSIHIFVNSNTTLQSYSRAFLSELEVSNTVLNKEKRRLLNGVVSEKTINEIPPDSIGSMNYRDMRDATAFYGTQIFTGVVDSVTDSYSAEAGKYTLNVKASNNLKWLKISRINKSPALVQQHGMLEDPVTPYLIKPDADGAVSTAALELLPENKALLNSGYVVSIRGGPFDGKIITERDLSLSAADYSREKVANIIHAPGLRYRWKEGIQTASQQFFIRSPGVEYDSRQDMTNLYGITLTTDPFSNLDVANVLSVLVTGYPYNFEKFLRNAIDAGNIDPRTIFNGGEDYFGALFNAVRVQNNTLGNFVPYATIGANKAQVIAQQLKIDSEINNFNNERRRINVEIAKLKDQREELTGRANILTDRKNAAQTIRERSSVNISEEKTQTLIANIDQELLSLYSRQAEIIKKSSELQESERNISSTIPCKYSVTTSDPTATSETGGTVEDKIKDDLDFFLFKRKSDVRYNRDMNLFVVSDEYDKDTDIQAFIFNIKNQNPELFETSTVYTTPLEICTEVAQLVEFEFFADANGNIQFRPPQYNRTPLSILRGIFGLKKQGYQQYPPWLEKIFENKYDMILRKIDELLALQDFDYALLDGDVDEANFVYNSDNFPKNQFPPNTVIDENYVKEKTDNNVKQARLRNDIEIREGEINRYDELKDRVFEQASNPRSKKEREVVEKLLQGKLPENLDINPYNYHLIEFDNINLLGYASGRRFIINDDVVINYSFSEGDEGIITRVDVQGQQNLTNTDYGDFAIKQYIWAGGTDFDLWQQYGFRKQDINKPFFNDSESQCRPYAAFLLNRQRKDVIKGSITVVGNEYYQLGDVVYVADRELLYYVMGVKHNFNYSGIFTTTLDLRYGHVPGDYIPTPLDVIGKLSISSRRREYAFARQNPFPERNERVIGTVRFMEGDDSGDIKLIPKNITALSNAYLIAKNYLKPNNEVALIIRSFYDEDQSRAETHTTKVKEWFQTPVNTDGEEIGYLKECGLLLKDKNVERTVLQSPVYLTTEQLAELEDQNIKALSPSEEVMDLMRSGGMAPENIVEISISFEKQLFRNQRFETYENLDQEK